MVLGRGKLSVKLIQTRPDFGGEGEFEVSMTDLRYN